MCRICWVMGEARKEGSNECGERKVEAIKIEQSGEDRRKK